MYRYGLVSVSFRGKTPEEIVDAVAEAGLTCIEWGSDVHAPCGDEERLKGIAALCRERGIEICSYGSYFRVGQSPIEELPAYIRAAGLLGTNIIRVWCGVKGYRDYSAEEWAALCRVCRQAAAMAQKAGVILCMECHVGTVTDCAEGALRLMKEVDSPHFRMYWQPNQFMSREENLDYAARIAPYVTHLHVFNWDQHARHPLMDGKDAWTAYLKAFSPDSHLLLEFMPDDRIESLPAEADAVRQIGGAI